MHRATSAGWVATVVDEESGLELFRATSTDDHFFAHAAALEWATDHVRLYGGRVEMDSDSYWSDRSAPLARKQPRARTTPAKFAGATAEFSVEADATTVIVTAPDA